MISKPKELFLKYREIILYIFFGVVSTIASLAACYIAIKLGVWSGLSALTGEDGEPTVLLDAIGSTVQWVVGVLVAFITNKKWVFTYSETGARATAKQLAVFSGSRVFTYLLELVLNIAIIFLFQKLGYAAFSVLGFAVTERIWAKVITSVVTVIGNYVLSKLLVFRKKTKDTEK